MFRSIMLVVIGVCFCLAVFVQAGVAYYVGTEPESFWPTKSPDNYAVLGMFSIGAMAILGAALVLASYVRSVAAAVLAGTYCLVFGVVIGDPWVPYHELLLAGIVVSVVLGVRAHNHQGTAVLNTHVPARSRY